MPPAPTARCGSPGSSSTSRCSRSSPWSTCRSGGPSPTRLRYGLLLAALLFAGGSAGIELVKGALYDDEHWSLSFGLVASFSDSLELIGLAILVAILLEHLATLTRGFDLRLLPAALRRVTLAAALGVASL